jgi:L-ascorbate metabolism protein UlaG (beta-lactamase superfamily)
VTRSRVGLLLALALAATTGCGNAGARSTDTATGAGARATDPATGGEPDAGHLTWRSITNWLVEAGDTRILLDGYVTRVDRTIVNADGTSTGTTKPDQAIVSRVGDVLLPDGKLDAILIGHGHWDHAVDASAWAHATDARIAGARSVCLQAEALGIAADRCTAVEGGEVLEIGPYVRARAVRWHHSGDSTAAGRTLRAPLELRERPAVDAATGGLRPGFLEDYPNGGGARAWLITVRTSRGPVTLFWSNTANALTWDSVLPPSDTSFLRAQGVDLSNLVWGGSTTAVRDHLSEAMRAEGLTAVDLWIGFPNARHIEQVASVLAPRTFIPQHWDDYMAPLLDGVARPFRPSSIEGALASAHIELVTPQRYFDRFRLEVGSVGAESGTGVRRRLGMADGVPAR